MRGIFFIAFISCFITCTVCMKEAQVIIIGAGASGLAAGVRLLENGIKDILILEAEGRTGGRVYTLNLDGRNIDMGAEWCHGEKGNVIYETLKARNLLSLLESEPREDNLFVSSRENVSKEFAKQFFECHDYAYGEEMDSIENESMGNVVLKRYNESIISKFGNDSKQLELARLGTDFVLHSAMSSEAAFSLFDVSASEDFKETPGDGALGWRNYGYSKFLDVLVKKYPNPKEQVPVDEKTLLNKEVTKITVNEDDINVVCSDHSTYKCKHVIFTPSLGVLKNQADSLFVPKLSKDKTDAIEKIGFGAVIKVFLKYERRWWGDLKSFNFIWTEHDKHVSKTKFPEGPTTTNGESWIVAHYTILAMPESNILSVWYTGDMVPAIEIVDENILKDGIVYTLDMFLGHLYAIPKPQKVLRTTWYSNPHFRGTYSFSSVNSTTEDIRNLQKPITNAKGQPRLQFAGEATNILHHSTVHGAVESGFREADRLIEFYKKTEKVT